MTATQNSFSVSSIKIPLYISSTRSINSISTQSGLVCFPIILSGAEAEFSSFEKGCYSVAMAPQTPHTARGSHTSSRATSQNPRTSIASSPAIRNSGTRSLSTAALQRVQIASSDLTLPPDLPAIPESGTFAGNAENVEDEDEVDALCEIVMAVDAKGQGTVGCCYYVARDEKLYFMEDVKLGGADAVEACMSPPGSTTLVRGGLLNTQ